MSQAVLMDITERIGYITLNNPEKRNALSPAMIEGLSAAMHRMNDDTEVKVIVIRALGSAFCAGADLAYLQQLQDFTYEENLEDSKKLMDLFNFIYTVPKIVIAEVQGHALAGGCGLVTVCDFAFSVPEALYGYTEVRIGFVPALVSVFLHEQIGGAKTQELLLSGERISASKSAEIGIITAVVPSDFLQKSVEEFASKLVNKNSEYSMGQTKSLLRKLNEDKRDQLLNEASQINAKARSHEDCKKGIAAFLNKETLSW